MLPFTVPSRDQLSPEAQGIYLIVSQLNGCEYCLASHTASAIKAGWKEEDTLTLRAGTHPDRKWQVIYAIVRSAIDNRGEVSDAQLKDFSALGFGDAAIIDLFVLINVMSFANYVFRLVKIPIDFPLAKEV
jgi:AhpD family alkylhydroperoxidase